MKIKKSSQKWELFFVLITKIFDSCQTFLHKNIMLYFLPGLTGLSTFWPISILSLYPQT